MGLLSPRITSVSAIFIVLIYLFLVINVRSDIPPEVHLVFLLVLGTLIFIAAFGFALNEIKETEGVVNDLDVGIGKLFSIFIFSALIAVGYEGLVLVLAEIFTGGDIYDSGNFPLSALILYVIIGVLLIYPFIQFYYLAKPGEDSSIPAEFPIETMMEVATGILKSPLLASIVVYFFTYIIPIALFEAYLDNILLAMLFWALILPLISIGALAGAGFGEDLIRLRMIRRPFKDLPKLGLPKINIRELQFDLGGFLLVLIAIQALFTTAYFGLIGLAKWLDIISIQTAAEVAIPILLLTFFNKGRGAFKELKEVWTESGFKVDTFQLFLPAYVFLGVILSSTLEVFASTGSISESSVFVRFNLADHLRLTNFILVVQNFILIFTAIYIWRRTPGTAERRLIKEVPEFYGDDIDGYLYIYGKLKDERSVENLLKVLSRRIRKDPSETHLLKGILRETLSSKNSRLEIAAAETLYTIVERQKEFDQEFFKLAKLTLSSETPGARIYGVRIFKTFIKYLEGVEKEEAIKLLQSSITDPDPVVSWDTSLALQRILIDEPNYRSFVLAMMIRSLNSTENQDAIDSIARFFNRIAKESSEIGQMAVSTLGVQLSSGKMENVENMIVGVKALLRGNSLLASDLLDQISMGLQHSDQEFRKNTYLVLSNLAQYGTGREEEVLSLVIKGINDESEEIQQIAFKALKNEVQNAPHLLEQIYTLLVSKFEEMRGNTLISALEVIEAIVRMDAGLNTQIFELIKGASNSSDPLARATVLQILSELSEKVPELQEQIYFIAEKNLIHENARVRQEAVAVLGNVVAGNARYARTVYRQVNKAREDPSYLVQLAAIEALGSVASASNEFADEIFEALEPLLNEDDDWQVRLAAYNGLFAATKPRTELSPRLVKATIVAMVDSDRTVRSQSLDVIQWLTDNIRQTEVELMTAIEKNMKRVEEDIQETLVGAMEIIALDSLLQVPRVLKMLGIVMESKDNNLRFTAFQTLKSALEKLQRAREISSDSHKELNNLMTRLFKAANNSNVAVRRTAYESITEICAALPEIKVANRGRTGLSKALKTEKDVGLIDFLEEAKIRAAPPLSGF